MQFIYAVIVFLGLLACLPVASAADRQGLAFGVGYRVFSSKTIYWGTSLIVGRYYTETDKEFRTTCLDCGKTLVDMELLKFEYAF